VFLTTRHTSRMEMEVLDVTDNEARALLPSRMSGGRGAS
jgi:hypothetical protein